MSLDHIYEKVTVLLGSTVCVLLATTWCIYQLVTAGYDFLDLISMVTFILGLLILRGQNVQASRMEAYVKRDLRKSDEVIHLIKD